MACARISSCVGWVEEEVCGSDILMTGGEGGNWIGDGPISISSILYRLVMQKVLKRENRNRNGQLGIVNISVR